MQKKRIYIFARPKRKRRRVRRQVVLHQVALVDRLRQVALVDHLLAQVQDHLHQAVQVAQVQDHLHQVARQADHQSQVVQVQDHLRQAQAAQVLVRHEAHLAVVVHLLVQAQGVHQADHLLLVQAQNFLGL